ncbi:hypothetical protein [Parvularcula lutaonensis]|uniref:Uncharacterized protein n=1 Tax=Parvularcula lutaonensis TaxID=491923 RepID=A0ABV7MCB2_9PROT|nr:hypothetical protein [Parvularcula lutaonensis]GGY46410.1 hypothetical protein GCM10007148_14400 [Parvularcula lutaonensis]
MPSEGPIWYRKRTIGEPGARRWRNYADSMYRSVRLFAIMPVIFVVWAFTPIGPMVPTWLFVIIWFGTPAVIGILYGARWLKQQNEQAFGAQSEVVPDSEADSHQHTDDKLGERAARKSLLTDFFVLVGLTALSSRMIPLVAATELGLQAIMLMTALPFMYVIVRAFWYVRRRKR